MVKLEELLSKLEEINGIIEKQYKQLAIAELNNDINEYNIHLDNIKISNYLINRIKSDIYHNNYSDKEIMLSQKHIINKNLDIENSEYTQDIIGGTDDNKERKLLNQIEDIKRFYLVEDDDIYSDDVTQVKDRKIIFDSLEEAEKYYQEIDEMNDDLESYMHNNSSLYYLLYDTIDKCRLKIVLDKIQKLINNTTRKRMKKELLIIKYKLIYINPTIENEFLSGKNVCKLKISELIKMRNTLLECNVIFVNFSNSIKPLIEDYLDNINNNINQLDLSDYTTNLNYKLDLIYNSANLSLLSEADYNDVIETKDEIIKYIKNPNIKKEIQENFKLNIRC